VLFVLRLRYTARPEQLCNSAQVGKKLVVTDRLARNARKSKHGFTDRPATAVFAAP
jgi:hypothetical protein